tara:strand:+ start:6 stop:1844 length:1839 start_codon:yes stop_codon:yes gene_type:complete
MTAFHRANLPSNLKAEEVMRLYLENIVQEKNTDSQGFIERTRFLKSLVSELDSSCKERIDRDELSKLDYFRPHLFNCQKDSPYVQLLDLGVLLEEWEDNQCFIRFAFDRLLEYLLAEQYWPKTTGLEDLKQLCLRLGEFKILQGSVEQLLYRFCMNDQPEIFAEIIDLSDKEKEIQPYIITISESLLLNMAIEDKDQFKKVINTFTINPGRTDLIIFKNLCETLYSKGYFKAFNDTIKIAKKEARALNEDSFLIELIIQEAQFNLLKGKYDKAKKLLQKSLELSDKIDFPKGMIISLRKLGVLSWRQGENEKSMDYFKKGLSHSQMNDYKLISAALINNIAVLKKDQGNISEAEKLYNESLKIRRELCDKNGISSCLNNLGNLKKNQGFLSKAEKLYSESLKIRRELGHKQDIAQSLNNIATLKKDQGNTSEAEKLFHESLEIRRELGDKKGIAHTLNNFALLKKIQGKVLEAEKLNNESLKIRKELSDKDGISESLNNLGIVKNDKGNTSEAEKLFNESLEIRRKLGNKKGIAESLNNLGNLKKNQGEISEAEKLFNESLEIRRKLGDKKGIAETLNDIGKLKKDKGDISKAEKLFHESQEITSELKKVKN